ncbi:flagellin [Sporosarcina sp. P26b]|uniref:flagellin N-terminal helical domain-containing protein n=1 Tax=Sporosarcina sp. P26b TaxID=2048253 RepID=UPI0013046218|nr:flagellin [Sporosarcina sp. P26b]
MIINHNLSAINTYRNQQQNNIGVANSINKLSSGLRINQAGDDSAGLAISEKMRGQIRGLEQAKQNIENGISLVQVAESGLGEIANPNLIRLRELTIQAANDTLTYDDRVLIQNEMNEVVKGIDQIANNTEFNTIPLLNGASFSSTNITPSTPSYNFENVLKENAISANGSFMFGTQNGYPTTAADNNQTLVFGNGGTSKPSVRIGNASFPLIASSTNTTQTTIIDGYLTTKYVINNDVEVTQSVKVVKDKYEIKYEIKNLGGDNKDVGFQFHLDTMLGEDDRAPFIVNKVKVETKTVYEGTDIPNEFIVYNQSTGSHVNAEFQAGGKVKGEGILLEPDKMAIGNYISVNSWDVKTDKEDVGDSGYSLIWNTRELTAGASFVVNTFYGQSIPPTIDNPVDTFGKQASDLLIQVGPNTGQNLKLQLSDVRTNKLGIANLNVLSHENANASLAKIDKAMETVTSERTKFGAYQNALEHIGKNVSNYQENLTASESRIRDLDMASEITKLSNNQIILQASQAMMSQANQVTQGVLQLLK